MQTERYIDKFSVMQVNNDKSILNKKKILIKAISTVVMKLLQDSGKSGRKFSAEYEIGIGVISKLEEIFYLMLSLVLFGNLLMHLQFRLANLYN